MVVKKAKRYEAVFSSQTSLLPLKRLRISPKMTAVFLTMEKNPICFADCWSLYLFLQGITNNNLHFHDFCRRPYCFGTIQKYSRRAIPSQGLLTRVLKSTCNFSKLWDFHPSHWGSNITPFVFNSTSISNMYAKLWAPDWLYLKSPAFPILSFLPYITVEE